MPYQNLNLLLIGVQEQNQDYKLLQAVSQRNRWGQSWRLGGSRIKNKFKFFKY